jgi:RNA polymerase sigma-70 factor (ECF subfamily)
VTLPFETPKALGVPEMIPAREHWSAFYDAHSGFVFRCLRRLGVPPAVLEDATQEVFLIAFERAGVFERRSSVRTWLHGIAFNVARRHFYASSRANAESLTEVLVDDRNLNQEDALARKRAVEDIYALLDGLSPDQRAVFVLTELEQLSAPEIAEITGVPLNTVYSRLRLGRREFEAALRRKRARDDWRKP